MMPKESSTKIVNFGIHGSRVVVGYGYKIYIVRMHYFFSKYSKYYQNTAH